MKRYLLLPEDTIEVLPEDGEAEAAVSVFCERTLMVFPCSGVSSVSMLAHVTEDRLQSLTCLQFTARDALFGAEQQILVPVSRPDYPAFARALEAARPELFAAMTKEEYVRETCDQTGSHLHKRG